MKIYNNLFEQITSLENLFSAWDAFKSDKRKKPDVMRFEWQLEENIFRLHRELKSATYRHGPYSGFYVTDPKQRHIHKALVRDRVLHHAVFSVINPIFEEMFIPTSFSCRVGYGTHRGVEALAGMMRQVSKNNTRTCHVLKCDVRKFFDSVDHRILLGILTKRIKDEKVMWLLRSIVESYSSEIGSGKGIPIGNLTSQLFANIYMNEFDRYMKHMVKAKHYLRYTDDFAIVSENRTYLEELLPKIKEFLSNNLAINLHPNKIILSTFCQGVDFLGYVSFPQYRLLRTKTRWRIFSRLRKN
ncbi:MAG: reverse transcriptase/maturase family protein [Patescibacteria group bacterium]